MEYEKSGRKIIHFSRFGNCSFSAAGFIAIGGFHNEIWLVSQIRDIIVEGDNFVNAAKQ